MVYKYGNNDSGDCEECEECGNCIFVEGLAKKECTCKHRISVKVLGSEESREYLGNAHVYMGVVPNYEDSDWCPAYENPFASGEFAFGMGLFSGALYGNEQDGSSPAGMVQAGKIGTMELDTDAHTLRFWVDGKPHGPGYTSGVVGSLRWGLGINPTRGIGRNSFKILIGGLEKAKNVLKLVIAS
jgi:hypothetical protein